MSTKNSGRKSIINALAWATAILVSSYLIKDTNDASIMLYIMIAGFFATNSLIAGEGGFRKDIECLRNKFRG